MTANLRILWIASVAIMALVDGHFAKSLGQTESVDIRIIADQIRSQGFSCTNPVSVERIKSESVPEEPMYLLICENAKYQVRLVPDQAAKVTPVK